VVQNAFVDIGPIRYATSSGGVDIAYQQFGRSDGPRLVFVSGFISHLDLNWEWKPYSALLHGLGAACRVLAFDKRGTGLSGRDLGFGSLAERTDDVRAVMDAAGWDQAHFLGVSEGGPISIFFAASHPERATSLSLYGTTARFANAPDFPEAIEVAEADPFFAWMGREWGTGKVMSGPLFAAHSEQSPLALTARFERSACTPQLAVEIMRRNFEIDVRELLGALRVPTLVVHASGDPLVPVALGRYLGTHIDGARYVEIPNDMHLSWHAEDYEPVLESVIEFITGIRHPVAGERVLATVLFTDIVDSTQRAVELGDRRWRALLDQHDDEAERTVDRFGGRLVKQTGDGWLATFDGPARAVQCAQTLRDALVSSGIHIRAGLHTAEVERRGADVGGIGVHIAARVASQASDGEVLVSRTVRDLVVGSDLRFEDRGSYELKGVPETWQLYAAMG
jgi:class 3 adenylate cyclase/pimeloyl-ACP methyl ester carboxylesterase